MTDWARGRAERGSRLGAAAHLARDKFVAAADAGALLEAVLRPGDRACFEGGNQKQADLLARALAELDPARARRHVRERRRHPARFRLFGTAIGPHRPHAIRRPDPRALAADATLRPTNREGQILCTLQALAAFAMLRPWPTRLIVAGYSVGEVAAWSLAGWAACLEACSEVGATAFLELGPGHALRDRSESAYPRVPARRLDQFRSSHGIRAWIESAHETD